MKRYRVTSHARIDLDEIWFYIAQDNVAAADKLIDEFVHAFRMLATHPKAGMAHDELAAGLRRHVVGKYLIFYKPTDAGIDISRVLHGARPVDEILRQTPS